MRRVHLAIAAAILLFCTFLTTLLPTEWSAASRGLLVGPADAFSKEQRKILMSDAKRKELKMGKMKGKWKGKMKGKMKGKKKNWD